MCEPDEERVSDHGEKVAAGHSGHCRAASKDHPACENADRVAANTKSKPNLNQI